MLRVLLTAARSVLQEYKKTRCTRYVRDLLILQYYINYTADCILQSDWYHVACPANHSPQLLS